MQYAFSMTSRMVTIAVTCAVLLCGLLFLLGVEIGVRFVAPAWSGGDAAARSASPSPEASAQPVAAVSTGPTITPAVAPVPTQSTYTGDVTSLPASSSTN